MVRQAVLPHRVPDRERDAEEALAADAPVAVEPVDPIVEARSSPLRHPAHFAPARLELLRVLPRPDEPLPARDDLERPLTLLVELDRVLDRLRVGRQRAGLGEQLRDLLLRLLRPLAREPVVRRLRRRRVGRLEPGLLP